MKIHFVTETEEQRWVLRYWSETLSKYIPNSSMGTEHDNNADVNVFVNYALYRSVPTKTAAIFTHKEREGVLRERFEIVAQHVDWCFAQCRNTMDCLPPKKTSVVWMYPQPIFYKNNLCLGVVGKPRDSGRKRFEWVKDLRRIDGVKVMTAKGEVSLDFMPKFYRMIDYLIILADNEGGPMPLLEAMAMGKPVIAPNVGHCWDLPVIRYTTKDELLNIVKGLIIPKDGWEKSAKHIEETCRRLCDGVA